MIKVAWVRYYPDQALLRAAGLSPRAELAHRRLADIAWSTGQFPSLSPGFIRAQLRCPAAAWPAVLEELLAAGWSHRRSRFWHPQVAATLSEAQRSLRASSQAGIRGNQLRWSPAPAHAPSPPDHLLVTSPLPPDPDKR
jgi:hypothetical protein